MRVTWRGGFAALWLLSNCAQDITALQRSAAEQVETRRAQQQALQRGFEARAGHESHPDAAKALAQFRKAVDGFLPALAEPFARKRRAVASEALAAELAKLDQAAAAASAAVVEAHRGLDLEMVKSRRDELVAFVKQPGEALTLNVEFAATGDLGEPSDDNELPLLRELVKLCDARGELEFDMIVPPPGNAADEREIRRNAENIANDIVGPQHVSLRHFSSDRLHRRQAIAQAMPVAEEEARKVVPSQARANARLEKLVTALDVKNRVRTALVENDEERPLTLWVVVKTPCAVP